MNFLLAQIIFGVQTSYTFYGGFKNISRKAEQRCENAKRKFEVAFEENKVKSDPILLTNLLDPVGDHLVDAAWKTFKIYCVEKGCLVRRTKKSVQEYKKTRYDVLVTINPFFQRMSEKEKLAMVHVKMLRIVSGLENNTMPQTEEEGGQMNKKQKKKKRKGKSVVYNRWAVEEVMANLDLVRHIAMYLKK